MDVGFAVSDPTQHGAGICGRDEGGAGPGAGD